MLIERDVDDIEFAWWDYPEYREAENDAAMIYLDDQALCIEEDNPEDWLPQQERKCLTFHARPIRFRPEPKPVSEVMMKKEMTRRQFFAQMRKIGYSKSPLQLTRMGVSYNKGRTMVTIPKDHEQTIMVTLSGDWRSGTWTTSQYGLGTTVNREALDNLGCSNLLEFVFRLMRGDFVQPA